MSGLAASRFGMFQRFLGPRSLQSQGVSLQNVRPIYDNGSRRWWDRFIYALIVTDLVATASFCELTWNHWTVRADPPKDTSLPSPSSSPSSLQEETQNAPGVAPHYALRPRWQRASLATYTLLGGVGLAFVLFSRRSSAIHRLYIIPNAPSNTNRSTAHAADRLLVVQSPIHSDAVGVVWPLQRSRLMHGNTPKAMRLLLKGHRAEYVLDLDGAQVLGENRSVADARKALFTEWYGDKKAAQMLVESANVEHAV